MAKLFANSGDPDQTSHPAASNAASDLGLHCLPNTLLRVSRLQWVNFAHLVPTHLLTGIHTFSRGQLCQDRLFPSVKGST